MQELVLCTRACVEAQANVATAGLTSKPQLLPTLLPRRQDPFPVFLKRGPLPKGAVESGVAAVGGRPGKAAIYRPDDFRLGGTISAHGRTFFLFDCDDFTRKYYKVGPQPAVSLRLCASQRAAAALQQHSAVRCLTGFFLLAHPDASRSTGA